MNTFGRNIKLSFFGETWSPFFGLTIDGIKPGVQININKINESLNKFEQPNIIWKFTSGIIGGFTTGSPITIIIENNETKSNVAFGYWIEIIIDDKSRHDGIGRHEGYVRTESLL